MAPEADVATSFRVLPAKAATSLPRKLWLIDLGMLRKIRAEDVKSSPSPLRFASRILMSSVSISRSLPGQDEWGEERPRMDTSARNPESHPLHRLFRGLTEYAFMNELGIGDPSLVGYVAELLASFVPSQGVWQLRDAQGKQPVSGYGDGRRSRGGR